MSCVILLCAAGGPAAAGQCTGPTCHVVTTGDLYDGMGGPLLAGHVYVIQGIVNVPATQTLTIQPGAVLKFDTMGFLPVPLTVFGSVVANGTAGSPIIFTSWRDDTAGGDTNGDGAATAPAPGDWKGVELSVGSGSGTPNVLAHCVLRHAGESGAAAVSLLTSDVTLTACTVSGCAGSALHLNQVAKPVVSGCSFQSCERPVRAAPLNALTGFTGNISSGHVVTDEISITFEGSSFNLAGNQTWTTANTMNGSGVVIVELSPRIPSGVSLTLGAGMILKGTFPWVFNVAGTLTCNGTAASPVVFTVVADDTFGGDTLKDGPAAVAPGAWSGLSFGIGSDASVLDHAVVRYAGAGGMGAVRLSGADITVSDTAIESSAGAGLQITSSAPAVTGCSFVGNQTAVSGLDIASLGSFTGNGASGNTGGDFLAIAGGTLSSTLTLGPANSLMTPSGPAPFVLTGVLSVAAGGHLTLTPGTAVKALGPFEVLVDGTLTAVGTAGDPIVFTSFRDDTQAGDTNNDGAATTPAPGDWKGLLFSGGSGSSDLQHVFVRYAGQGVPAVRLISADIAMSDCVVDHAGHDGLDLGQSSAPAVTGCSFDSCVRPVAGVPLGSIPGFTGCTASGNSSGDVMEIRGGSAISSTVTLSSAHTLNQSGVFVFGSSLTVLAGGQLVLDPQTVIKLSGPHSLMVSGALLVPAGPAWITSLDDDATGGDTAGDGPTTGSPGDWGTITLNGSALLENLTVRYGGAGGNPAIALQSAAGIRNVTVEHSAGPAVSGSAALVSGCAFDHNDVAVAPRTIADVQGFSGNTATGNAQGDTIRLTGSSGAAGLVLGPDQSLNGTGVFVLEGSVQIPSGADLTILAGTILKVDGPHLFSVQALIDVSGSPQAPVVVTSIRDDAYGGDTNGDGGTTQPAPGDWGNFEFASASDVSTVANAIIRYGGAGSPAPPAVNLHSSDIVLTGVTIEKCAGTAVHANDTSNATIQGCTFFCNGGKAIDGLTWATLGNLSGVTASANGGGQTIEIFSPVVAGDVVVSHDNAFGLPIVVHTTPVMGPGDSLTLGEGVIIKAANPMVAFNLNQDSHILGTPTLPVVMTSIRDDTQGGDTNMDGGATVPAPGDWIGIECSGTGKIQHLLLRYAGFDPNLPFDASLRGQVTSIEETRVEHGLGGGFHVRGHLTNCVAWSNGRDGFAGGVVSYSTAALNGGVGMTNGFTIDASFRGCNSWANGVANYGGIFLNLPPAGVFYTTEVVWCNGIDPVSCPPSTVCTPVHYVTNVDPQFIDLANGDLRLAPGSPVADVIPLSSPVPGSPGSTYDMDITRRDFLGRSRQVDSDLTGPNPALSDVGAFESSPYTLDSTGLPKLGASISYALSGPTGFGVLTAGLEIGSLHAPPYGFLLTGNASTATIVATVATGTPYVVPIPAFPPLVGFRFSIQGLGFLSANPAAGAFTGLWRATIYP